MKVDISALKPGDVIRTNPQEGFWGCAVVLDRFSLAPLYQPEACHIAITSVVKKSEFALEEICASTLNVLEFEQHYSPTKDSLYVKTVTCITKYLLTGKHVVELIGTVDSSQIYSGSLSTSIGGSSGGFPLRNRIDEFLGNEAIITWRRKYDSEAWDALVAKSNTEYFDLEEERLLKNRKARAARVKKNT